MGGGTATLLTPYALKPKWKSELNGVVDASRNRFSLLGHGFCFCGAFPPTTARCTGERDGRENFLMSRLVEEWIEPLLNVRVRER